MTLPSWRQAPIAAPLPETPSPIRLGLGANYWRQFTLLVVINAFVERWWGSSAPSSHSLPRRLRARLEDASFPPGQLCIVKALANLFAGQLATGSAASRSSSQLASRLPVPLLIIWAPSWG